jgi:autotransporter-associated beta strand protein
MAGARADARAADWGLTAGGSWATDANWANPAAKPDAVGAVANFTANNSASRIITVDSGAVGFTVGAINFDLTGTGSFTNSIQVGSAGSNLHLNNGGAGATITTTGNGTGNNTISAPFSLDDNVIATVNQVTSSSAAGSLNLTATISGTGGFTKQGSGLMTFGTGAKTYTGPTVLDTNSGRTRISFAARPQNTSSLTVKSGAQIEFLTNGDYTFGGPLNLNGSGIGAFPGAIRPTRDVNMNIPGPTVLESDTVVHMQGTGQDASTNPGLANLSFGGVISGSGHLQLTANGSNFEAGRYSFAAANTMTGGVTIIAGTLNVLDGAGLGTGPIDVSADVAQAVNTLMNLNFTGAAPATTSGPLSGHIGGNGATTTIRLNGTSYTVNQTADGTYVGTIADGNASGSFGLGATSTNTLTATGNLTYTGATSVAGGRLALATNLTATSGVTVSGGTLELTTGGGNNRVIHTPSIAVTGTGRLNIQDNKLVTATPVGTTTGTTYDGISGMIQSGRNGGGWTGSGIVTSQTDATTSNFTSIGVATGQQVKGLANPSDTAVWGGRTVSGSDTLVMYTYGGDANLDGKINVDDYGRIDLNIPIGTTGWYNGDFNYDGKINVDDYGIIDFNVGIQGAPFPTGTGAGVSGVSAVPEPASLATLLIAGSTALPGRRRRKS